MPDVNLTIAVPGEQLLIAFFRMVTAIVEGQPPEVKKQLWDWYVKDWAAIRKFLKIDD